jgi:hypothetical protein
MMSEELVQITAPLHRMTIDIKPKTGPAGTEFVFSGRVFMLIFGTPFAMVEIDLVGTVTQPKPKTTIRGFTDLFGNYTLKKRIDESGRYGVTARALVPIPPFPQLAVAATEILDVY